MAALPAVGGLMISQGCAPAIKIHPDFEHLRPRVIQVLPVKNETIHQLDKVSFGGPLQRTVIGVPSYDVPDLLRGALEEALILRGYQTAPSGASPGDEPLDFRHPLPEGAASLPFDAVLYTTIEAWSATTMAAPAMSLRYRLEMYRVPTAEVLLWGHGDVSYREDLRSRGTEEIPNQIRHSAQKALAWLPRTKLGAALQKFMPGFPALAAGLVPRRFAPALDE